MRKLMMLYIPDTISLPIGKRYAKQYHFKLTQNFPLEEKYFLSLDAQGLSLKENKNGSKKQLFIDFTSGKAHYRRLHGGGKNQLLAKAIGANLHKHLNVLDATAGLGKDAFVLATLGCNVTLIEESPIIASLLEDALSRAKQSTELSNIIQHMHFVFGNSIQYMEKIPAKKRPDIIYLDPMFPIRKKTALVKKEMQVLQDILEIKHDDQLLLSALNCAKKQVVVKRPRLSNYLNDLDPTRSMIGKSCRFDIYLTLN